jgi:hypothetical protein
MPNYRAGSNVTVPRSGQTFSYAFATPLPAGTYAVQVMLRGSVGLGLGGNPSPMIVLSATSNNQGFSFQFVDISGTNPTVFTPSVTSVNVDYIVVQTNNP